MLGVQGTGAIWLLLLLLLLMETAVLVWCFPCVGGACAVLLAAVSSTVDGAAGSGKRCWQGIGIDGSLV